MNEIKPVYIGNTKYGHATHIQLMFLCMLHFIISLFEWIVMNFIHCIMKYLLTIATKSASLVEKAYIHFPFFVLQVQHPGLHVAQGCPVRVGHHGVPGNVHRHRGLRSHGAPALHDHRLLCQEAARAQDRE